MAGHVLRPGETRSHPELHALLLVITAVVY